VASLNVYQVKSTGHQFSAPKSKYDNIKGDLGLIDVTTDDGKREGGKKLAPGYGYVRITARLKKSGTKKAASVSLICDPDKVGSAFKNGANNKVNGRDVDRIYIPGNRYQK
jgi:hypothetical protein